MTNSKQPAVVLLSGGLDSATALAMARNDGYDCYALSLNYGQRHNSELAAAKAVAKAQGVSDHKIIDLDLRNIGGSALTDDGIDVPKAETEGIPVTYVPARNTVFLSLALGWAEVLQSQNIYLGVNAVDYSGYPDCRPEFISSFQQLANLATKSGVEGRQINIRAPLIDLTKPEIIQAGYALDVDYSLTVSCYDADEQGRACGKCDSCRIRADGFKRAGVNDPTRYRGQA